MANVIKEHKLIDNNRRALLKYTVMIDGTAMANNILVDVSSLAFAMNANNKIMSSNTHPKGIYRTTIKHIYGTCKANTYAMLQWHGVGAIGNSEIVLLASGDFNFNLDEAGSPATLYNPDEVAANSTGDILLSLNTPNNGDMLTLFIDLKKDGRDYDAGQTADPAAFNRW